MWQEFKAFLIKQNALALAIAVVLGVALNAVVQGIVNDLIMPLIAVATPKGDWQTYILSLGPVHLKIGDLASAVINFFIIGFVVWRISKLFIRPEPAAAPPPTKMCPFCKMSIAADATRCAYCTSALS
jgi:large conductance mechanosensitive channel